MLDADYFKDVEEMESISDTNDNSCFVYQNFLIRNQIRNQMLNFLRMY